MNCKYIAFDVDGTLIDALPAALRTLQDVLYERTGRKYPMELLRKTMGLITEDMFPILSLEYSEELIEEWTLRQLQASDRITIFPGVPETLSALKARGCVLGIVTSRNREEYEADRKLFDQIEAYFDCVVLAEMTREHKPEPEPLYKFMELCGASPEQALYVGDTEWDMRCASAAGLKGGLALWGALNKDVQAPYIFNEPKDILDLVL